MTKTAIRRRHLLALSALGLTVSRPARAQSPFPSRPLKIVVPYAPGGGVDVVGRVLAQALSAVFGQTVIVENKAGAGSSIGSSAVARADPDGLTVLLNGGTLAMQPSIVKNLGYDVLRDFEPVSSVVTYGLTLTVGSQVPATTLKEFIGYARARGTEVFYGSPGPGTTPHLAAEYFNSVAGTRMTHVPYKGNGPLMTALLAGEVQVGFDTISNSKPHVDAGTARVLALTGRHRNPGMPEVPTAVEAGLEGFELDMWQGIFLPRGTPAAVIATWNVAVNRALAMPEVVRKLTDHGFSVNASSPEQLRSVLEAEVQLWSRVARRAGLRPE